MGNRPPARLALDRDTDAGAVQALIAPTVRDILQRRRSLEAATEWALMGKGFWIRRFVLAFVVAALILLASQLLKGHDAEAAARFALLWGAITATLFTLAGYLRYRRNPACMLPRDRN